MNGGEGEDLLSELLNSIDPAYAVPPSLPFDTPSFSPPQQQYLQYTSTTPHTVPQYDPQTRSLLGQTHSRPTAHLMIISCSNFYETHFLKKMNPTCKLYDKS